MIGRVPARLLLAVVLPLAVCGVARADSGARSVVRVALAPLVKDHISGVAWRAMTAECAAIWASEGIAVTWAADATADVRLPVVFDGRVVRQHDPKGDDAFGITLFVGRLQRILVSAPRARQVVAQRRGLSDSGDGVALDIATGLLLGRVVAHELGHALLLTTRHGPRGLMRAQFDSRDLRPRVGDEFALSRHERERLATRFSNEPTAAQLALADVTWLEVPPVPSRPRARR